MSTVVEELRRNGHMAELRFFVLLNQYLQRPEWLIYTAQENALWDTRNVDGFAWIRKTNGDLNQIPLQVTTSKYQFDSRIDGSRALYIMTKLDWTEEKVCQGAIERLSLARDIDYSDLIRKEVSREMTAKDVDKIGKIVVARAEAEDRFWNTALQK